MRLATLAFLLALGVGLCRAAQPPPTPADGEQWMRQYLTELSDRTQAHRTYLQILLSLSVLVIGILGVVVVRWGWRNRQDIKYLREASSRQVETAPASERLAANVRLVLASTLTKYEYFHLNQLARTQAHLVKYSDALAQDIRRLEALDFITGTGNEPGYRALFRMVKEQSRAQTEFNLKQLFRVTEQGKDYLRQRGAFSEGELNHSTPTQPQDGARRNDAMSDQTRGNGGREPVRKSSVEASNDGSGE